MLSGASHLLFVYSPRTILRAICVADAVLAITFSFETYFFHGASHGLCQGSLTVAEHDEQYVSSDHGSQEDRDGDPCGANVTMFHHVYDTTKRHCEKCARPSASGG